MIVNFSRHLMTLERDIWLFGRLDEELACAFPFQQHLYNFSKIDWEFRREEKDGGD